MITSLKRLKGLKRYFSIFLVTFGLIVLLFSCTSRSKLAKRTDFIRVGTFNLEWLGDSVNDRIDRDEEDYQRIADVIASLEVDILGVQEIENASAIQRVLKYLPDYRFVLSDSKGNKQNVGFLIHNSIEVKSTMEYNSLAVVEGRTRPALILEGKKGNFDWIAMVVHLKSTSRYDDSKEKQEESFAIRSAQAKVISDWVDSVLRYGKEKDIIIVGDFNDTPRRKKNNTLYWLMDNPNLFFLTDSLKSCKYKNWYVIDHVVASRSALSRYKQNSLWIFNLYDAFSRKEAELISDHCPITADFEIISPDND